MMYIDKNSNKNMPLATDEICGTMIY